ncbi:uncharacterized protein LAJ45_05136 [Morchella importuna]|uniref:uncharacterized protein n=1 Tax=Morchella importuna TaxID=1174673 RepID=UPI001E8E3675|nr:uncharacterized protein LAJ45_05136 [Morchella importuna]KAH8150953.1 hypothetical protein LAJ45_05136 [Morchella importuna]
MFISTRLRASAPSAVRSIASASAVAAAPSRSALHLRSSLLSRNFCSTPTRQRNFYQRTTRTLEDVFYFRQRTWFFSGILISILATVPIIMATREYIALSDAETLTAFTPSGQLEKEIEEKINTHPLTLSLRSNPDFTESRPTLKLSPTYRPSSLTSGVLSGPRKIVVPPFTWAEEEGKSMTTIMYLGEDLCGHPGIVHGGLLATLLDEGLARCCFPALPNKIAMTASLTMNYRKPTPAGNYYVLRAKTVKVEGRKAWVEGHIETLPKDGEEPVVMVEANALMIEPKQAKLLMSIVPQK